MKRILLLSLLVVGSIACSCGDIKKYPAGPLEYAAGGADNATYPFESVSDTAIFSLNGTGFTGMAYSTAASYAGSGSIKLNCKFNQPNAAQGRLVLTNVTASTLAGKTVTAHIWVPNGMGTADYSYGGFFYFQFGNSNNNDWYQSAWQNLNVPTGAISGRWNTISTTIDTMTLVNGNGTAGHVNGNTVSQNGVNTSQAVTWGTIVAQGGLAPDFYGTMYIDSINVE